MKKVISLSLVALLTLSLVSCSSGIKATTSPENYSDLDKEYGQFNTKALTVSYLKKKLDKWKKDNNGKKMLRELEYAKFKHINILEQVINSQPDSYAYYEGLKSFIEVTSKEGNDAAFKSFIVSLSPDPTVSTALDASNITSTSFTANWSVVTNATGYMLIVDNGTPIDVGNVTSKNITGLTAGSSHSYVVKSVNEGGVSEASSPVNVILKTDAPVASDATSLAQTSFTANWGTVTGATSYKLFVDNTEVYTGSSTSCNVTSLAVGSSHSYYVQAINAGGTSPNSNTINLTLNPAIAGVPVASDATDITQTSFTANWATVSGAASYKLFIDDVEAYSGSNLSFSKTGLTVGSSHSYYVQAVNISGASANSNSINLTLNPAIPSAPVANLATDITTTSFTANWGTVSGATSYKLFIDDVEAYSGTNLNFSKTGLTAGTAYTYYVQAINISGTGSNSNTVNVRTVAIAPVASDATSITDTSFTANWATVTGATGYNLFVDGISVYTGTSTSANITALTANSSHSYYVQATNAGGNSANSNTVNLTLNPATPVTPTASPATNITTTGFTANWASVSGATAYKLKVDSGAFTDVGNVLYYDITGLTPASTHTYTVQASNINGTSSNSTPDISVTLKTDAPVASAATSITDTSFTANWGTVTGATGYNLFVDGTSVYTGTSTSCNVTGFTANSSHNYYVQATNAGGTSTNSNTINLTLNPATPVTPTASAATNITTTGFTANWASVSGATTYKLKVDSGSFTDIGNVTSYSVTGLTPATTHTYSVEASNINGTSSNSTPDISVTLKTIAPVASSATSITDTSFTANWATVTGATGYKLYVDSVNVYTGASTSVNVTGLSSGVTHSYYVQATNAGGNSANSNTINALTIPSAPVASTASDITQTSFTANWATVTGATSYKLIVDGGTPITVDGGATTSKSVSGLNINTNHIYYVQAVNATGTSSNSNTINVTLTQSIPEAPVTTDATNISTSIPITFTANWTAVNGATSYKLTVAPTGRGAGAPQEFNVGGVTSYSVTTLPANTTIAYYYVQAINSSGTSANSNSIYVSKVAPSANVASNITQTSFTANWSALTDTSSYKLTIDNGTPIDVGTATSYSVTGLTPGSTHTYYVQAVRYNIISNNSSTISVTLPDVNTGLLAYYPFTGNTNDASGNNNNGSIVGGVTLTTDRLGNANKAYSFDGSSGYITLNSVTKLNLGNSSSSFSLWFNTTTPTIPYTILSKQKRNSPYTGYDISLINSNNLNVEIIQDYSLSKTSDFNFTTNDIADGAWHHLVAVYESNNTCKLYIDNVLQSSYTLTGAIGDYNTDYANASFELGSRGSDNGTQAGANFFKGKMDDVRVYNRALNSSDVSYLYNN